MAELSQAEVDERIAILKRFRHLLTMQRDRFRTYVDGLDAQKDLIEQGNTEDLANQVELEEKIAGDIIAIQKAIEPMQAMYEFAWRGKEPPEVPQIRGALENLKAEAKKRWGRNKALLQERMAVMRNEIKELRSSPLKRRRSVYAETPSPSMIDIKG